MIIDDSRPVVLALGGNAISREGEEGTIDQQFQHTRATAKHVVNLLQAGCRLVVTHGNGPQVGNVIRRVELARPHIYPLPVDVCVADTQGGMGYMIAQCLNNELRRRGINRTVCTLVTTVQVDEDDPAFDNPTKPIGSFYAEAEARTLMHRDGWAMARIGNKGWRRVVPSPAPQAIVEIDLLKALVDAGQTVIAGGGGGIPVIRDVAGDLQGVEG
ncbi:MAG: carbamate kinase, partial [Planctomycetota bacterium]